MRPPAAKIEQFAKQAQKGLWAAEKESTPTTPATAEPAKTAPIPIYSEKTTPKANAQEAADVTVYATRTGTKYHRAGCRYLSKSQIPMPLSEAKSRYSPCSVCRPPE